MCPNVLYIDIIIPLDKAVPYTADSIPQFLHNKPAFHNWHTIVTMVRFYTGILLRLIIEKSRKKYGVSWKMQFIILFVNINQPKHTCMVKLGRLCRALGTKI